jgi:hypothetical protein
MKTNSPLFILLVFLSGFFYSNHTICQKNYLPGMIITLKNDTLKGFIDYQNWAKNPKSISFKVSENASPSEYNPLGINGFIVQTDVYVSAIVQAEDSRQMEYNPNQIKEADYNPEIKLRTDTIFLQAMYQGSKNLYYSYDEKGKPQFYIKQWPDFELLIYKKYLRYNEERIDIGSPEVLNAFRENKKFIGQLTLYFQDCPAMQQKLNNAVYEQKSLENIFDDYYKCAKSKPSFKYDKEKLNIKLKLEYGVLAGISSTKLLMSSSEEYMYRYTVSPDYKASTNFSGGVLFDVVLARNQRRWSIYNELIYTSFSVAQHFEEVVNEDIFTLIDTKIAYSYLKWNSMLRYKYFVKNDWFMFANSGISLGYAIEGSNSITIDKTVNEYNTHSEKQLFEDSKSETGVLVGLGGGYKKISFEARYERGNGISDNNLIRSRTNRMYLLMGYRF